VERGVAPLQGKDAIDQLRDAALADAAPHEPHVSQVIVVAQDGHAAVARPQSAQRSGETLSVELLGGVAREVARDGDEVRPLAVDLLDHRAQAFGLRPVVEVEVADLHHAVAVELRRQPRQGERHGPDLHPAGLHLPRVDDAAQANLAYLSGFPFHALLRVAPYCARGGVRVLSSGDRPGAIYRGSELRKVWIMRYWVQSPVSASTFKEVGTDEQGGLR